MIVYGDPKPKVGVSDRVVVVDKIENELDEEDQVIQVLYGWFSGDYQRFVGKDEKSFKYKGSLLKCGDIVRLAKDDKGMVASVEEKLYFRVDNNPQNYFTTYITGDYDSSGEYSVAYGYHQTATGRVDKVYGDFLRIEINNGKYINVKMTNSVSYIHYDASLKKPLSKSTMSDVKVGDYIFFGTYE